MPSSGGPGGQWNVAALLARRRAAPPSKTKRVRATRFESRFEYLVQWEDCDPTTGEPYEPSWEPTTYITPAAIESYYIEKYEATADAQRPVNDAAADGASAAVVTACADDVAASVPGTAPEEKIATKAAPAKADGEAIPKRPKTTRAADEATPKRQKSTRTAHSSTKDKEKEKQGAEGGAADAALPPQKRGTSPTPDTENTKRIRVADMLLA